jgi:hypothetical protein
MYGKDSTFGGYSNVRAGSRVRPAASPRICAAWSNAGRTPSGVSA